VNRLKYEIARLSAAARRVLPTTSPVHKGTRILMFHDLNSQGHRHDVYSLPSKTFADSIRALAEWASEEHSRFVAFSGEPTRGIAVTFDDGYRSTLKIARAVLNEYSIPFHVFITKQFIESGDTRYLTAADIKALSAVPFATFGLHGLTHTPFSQLEPSALRSELRDSRKWLEDLVGRPVATVSYPHGDFDQRVTEIVASEGLVAAACSAAGTFQFDHQRFTIPRIDIWSLDSANVVLAKTRGDWDHVLP